MVREENSEETSVSRVLAGVTSRVHATLVLFPPALLYHPTQTCCVCRERATLLGKWIATYTVHCVDGNNLCFVLAAVFAASSPGGAEG